MKLGMEANPQKWPTPHDQPLNVERALNVLRAEVEVRESEFCRWCSLIVLPNNWRVSTSYGAGSYCEWKTMQRRVIVRDEDGADLFPLAVTRENEYTIERAVWARSHSVEIVIDYPHRKSPSGHFSYFCTQQETNCVWGWLSMWLFLRTVDAIALLPKGDGPWDGSPDEFNGGVCVCPDCVQQRWVASMGEHLAEATPGYGTEGRISREMLPHR